MSFLEPRFESKQTTLHVLAGEGHPNLIFQLLQRYNATVRRSYINLKTEGGSEHQSIALHLAVRRWRLGAIRVLSENGADMNACVHAGDTALLYAVKHEFTEVMQTVLYYGADVNLRDRWGKATLHCIAMIDDLKPFEVLMQYGSDVDVRSYEGLTPLMFAVINLQPAMMKALVAHAADISAKDKLGSTPLCHAMFSSATIWLLHVLLQHGADPNVRSYDAEPFLAAVVRNRIRGIEDVQLLIRYGADVNASGNVGRTALQAAIKRRVIDIIELLLQHNADVNARRTWEAPSLMMAMPYAYGRNIRMIELLLKHGANVITVGEWSTYTALRVAVESVNVEVIKLLLVYGTDVYSQRQGKPSIMDIAHGKPDETIVRLLSYFTDVPPRSRFEAARAREHQDWWKDYVRRNMVR